MTVAHAAFLVLVTVFAGCSDSREAGRLAGPSTCESSGRGEVPKGASKDSIEADMDGDGKKDHFSVWARGDTDDYIVHMRLQVGSTVIESKDGGNDMDPLAIGGTDLDGDGRSEAWVASGEAIWPVIFDDCELKSVERRPPENGDRDFILTRDGGGSGFTAGTRCADIHGDDKPEIVQYEWNDQGVNPYEQPTGWWQYYAYNLKGERAVLVAKESEDNRKKSDKFAWELGFHCEGVELK